MPREPADAPAPSELLPLTPAVLHVLLALAAGESHGYAIAQEAERVSDGRVRLGPGTLYGSLQRMLAGGLIAEAARDDEGDERRRYYALTPLGSRVLRAEAARLAALVALAGERGVLPAPEGA